MLTVEDFEKIRKAVLVVVGNIEKGARWSIEMDTTLGLRIPLCKGFVNS